MTLTRTVALIIKPIGVVAMLAASPAQAADARNGPPVIVEDQPPCIGPECSEVWLDVVDQCIWASNKKQTPVVLVLSLANGATMQFMLKSATSYTAANAPYTPTKQCESIQNVVEAINKSQRNAGEAIASSPTMMEQLKTCHAANMAAQEANFKKDEYYGTGSRAVGRREGTLGLGGSFISTASIAYPIYNQRLKNGAGCLDAALHDIKSYAAAASQTIGSWTVSGANGVGKAVLTPSAITIPPSGGAASGANAITFQLQVEYNGPRTFPSQKGTFYGSSIYFSNGIVPANAVNTVFHVLADGKDVGQFGNGAGIGDLRAMFGADLAGLASAQQISVVANSSPTGNTTFFVANLQQTAAALAAIKTFANAM